MGDSAGGNFCAVLANKYKDRIAGQVLVNPGLDLTENGAGFQNLSMFIEWYLSDMEQAKEENVSPLLAQSFSGLPPSLIITCENDPLKEDGNAYFIKLKEAGVPVTIKDFKGFSHLAHLWAGTSDDTREIREFVVQETKNLLENSLN